MDSERRKWLEQALDAAFGGESDPNKLMIKAVSEVKEGKVSAGLDILDYTSDFPDCAENVEKVGALAVIIGLITSEDPLIARRALEVLNMYLPNNARIQLAAALKYECLPAIKRSLERYYDNGEVLHLCLSVMGSLIRNVAPLEASFIREGNVQSLVGYAKTISDMKSLQKIVGIISSLSTNNDLSNLEDEVHSLTVYVYENHGTFDSQDIQFWEVASRLSQIGKCGSVCTAMFESRRRWIKSLSESSQCDFSLELETLEQIRDL